MCMDVFEIFYMYEAQIVFQVRVHGLILNSRHHLLK